MKRRQHPMPVLIITIVMLNTLLPFLYSSVSAYNLPTHQSSDVLWNPVEPLPVADDDQCHFWTIENSGSGTIKASISDSLNSRINANSLEILSDNGTYAYFEIYHKYQGTLNFYMLNVFVFWWYGNGTNANFRLHLYTPSKEDSLYYDFCDDFSGWRQIVLYFDKNFTWIGRPNLSLLKEIHISLETANVRGTWYLDCVFADVISVPTPETYLAEYEWSLNKLLEHRDDKSGQVLASWGASNDSRDYEDVYRFDLTLPTFTEAYKITGNKTYLNIAKESFDKAITNLYNRDTNLFSTLWNSTSNTYVDTLDILWGAVLLNGMYDFYSVSLNSTYLYYANNFAQALHTYGINQTTNLPHHRVSVSNGNVVDTKGEVPMDIARLIGAYIKGYEVTSIEKYKDWAKDLAEAFWAKRNVTTNLIPLCIDSNGTVVLDFWKPNLDPIQNVLLYAYNVTKDEFYLSLAINLTEAELIYAWSEQLGRTVQSVKTNGTVRWAVLDLVDGPQMYIIGLLQLYQFTHNRRYLAYAEKLWNTMYDKASLNGLYATLLDGQNDRNNVSNLYTQQMAVQCDAYLFHLTKNQTYLEKLRKTVNSFLLNFKMPYGFCHSINMTSYETISDSTVDWLDSSSYTLGAAIYAYSVYSTQDKTNIEAELTYYVPYYPMFKIKGALNYSNNRISFHVNGAVSYLNLTFTIPQGKTLNSIEVDKPSIFLYVENVPHLLIWENSAYAVTVVMKNGTSQDISIEEFEFVNGTGNDAGNRLKATFRIIAPTNMTAKIHIPYNETSQMPFPHDAWDINCTGTLWGSIWDNAHRILTMWIFSNDSVAILIENLSPEPVKIIEAKLISQNSVELVWTEATVRDFAKYEVYCLQNSSQPTDQWKLIHTTTEESSTTCTVTNLLFNTTYYFIVRTYDTAGLHKDSERISVEIDPQSVVVEVEPQLFTFQILFVAAILVILITALFLVLHFSKIPNSKLSQS